MSLNDANTSGSCRKNMITIDFAIKNKKIEESNRNTKVGLEI